MKKISIIKSDEKNSDHEFCKTKTPEERLSAVEFLREQCAIIQGYDQLPSIFRKISIRKRGGQEAGMLEGSKTSEHSGLQAFYPYSFQACQPVKNWIQKNTFC